jgi:hypothetical protein
MQEDMVMVYSYKCWDQATGSHTLMPTKATVDALARMELCTPLPGTAEEVPLAAVDDGGLYWPLESSAAPISTG